MSVSGRLTILFTAFLILSIKSFAHRYCEQGKLRKLFAAQSAKPTYVAAFRERNVGVFEGLTQEEAQARYPELWVRNITRRWHEAPPDGETIADVFARTRAGLDQLISTYPRKTVLLIGHGFIAKVLRSIVLGHTTDFFEWQLDNGKSLELIVPLRTRYAFPQSGSF